MSQRSRTPRGQGSLRRTPRSARSKKSLGTGDDFDPSSVITDTISKDILAAVKNVDRLDFLRILVEEDGIPLVGFDQFGNSCLHVVANVKADKSKIEAMLDYLLSKGMAPFLHSRNVSGQSAVMTAASNHRWDAMEYLIGVGADIITKATTCAWDEVYAIGKGVYQDGQQSLWRGINQQIENKEKGTLAAEPVKHKKSELREFLFKVSRQGDMITTRYVVEHFAVNVNALDNDGNIVLHVLAPDNKRLRLIEYLVENGTKVRVKNKLGETPALIAARAKAWDNMKFLISRGASVSTKDAKGKSVFKYAQVNEQGKAALDDGLAMKKVAQQEGQLGEGVSECGDANEGADGASSHASEQKAPQSTHAATAGETNGAPPRAHQAAAGSAPAAEGAAANNPDEADPAPVEHGPFEGLIRGKKKDKAKAKECQAVINSNFVAIHYRKGSFITRKDLTEEYPWHHEMEIRKDPISGALTMVLNKAQGVILELANLPNNTADILEELGLTCVWNSVFDESMTEAKQLFNEFEVSCEANMSALHEKLTQRSEAAVTGQAIDEQLNMDIETLLGRTEMLRLQGQGLRETLSKMIQALERRLQVTDIRRKEFLSKGQEERALEVQRGQAHNRKKLRIVIDHHKRVEEMVHTLERTKEHAAESQKNLQTILMLKEQASKQSS